MLQYDRPPIKKVYLMSVDNVTICVNTSWRMCYLAMMARYSGFGILIKSNHTYIYDRFIWECTDGQRETVVIEESDLDPEYFIPEPYEEGAEE